MQWAGNLWEELGNFDMPVKFTVLQICKTTAFFNNHDYDYRTDAYSQKLKCHVQGYFCHCKRDEKAAQRGHVRKLNNRVRRGINKKRVSTPSPLLKAWEAIINGTVSPAGKAWKAQSNCSTLVRLMPTFQQHAQEEVCPITAVVHNLPRRNLSMAWAKGLPRWDHWHCQGNCEATMSTGFMVCKSNC